MKWVIHDLVFGMAEHEEFIKCLDKHGHEYEVFNTFAPIPDGDIVRCSVDMAKVWRDSRGIMCNWQAFDCSEYYPYFEKYLLADSFFFTSYGDLRKNAEQYFELYGNKDGWFFLRPNSGGKIFVGELVEKEGLKRHREWYKDAWSDDLVVMVAEPVEIIKEYRLVVIGDKVVSGSMYKALHGSKLELDTKRIEPDHEAFKYADKVLTDVDYRPDPAFIIDVAETSDGFRVIELNSFTCSGLYDCDPEPIVLGMN
jgi:hypothetical protein